MAARSRKPNNSRKPLTPEQQEAIKNVKDKIAEVMAKKQGQVQPGQPQLAQVIPPKPDEQHLDAGVIHWKWVIPDNNEVWVYANYYQDGERAGEYDVDLMVSVPPGEEIHTIKMVAEDAQAIGLALFSASQWKVAWPNFAGEFLLAGVEHGPNGEARRKKEAPVPPPEQVPDVEMVPLEEMIGDEGS
jgi:hypothetical protein